MDSIKFEWDNNKALSNTGEYSHEIYKMADASTMRECWLDFHIFNVVMAIDDLKEIDK